MRFKPWRIIAVLLLLIISFISFRLWIQPTCQLISHVRNNATIDPHWLWQWRDRSGGYFTFDPTIVSPGMTHRFSPPASNRWILETYTSPTVTSEDEIIYSSQTLEALLGEEATALDATALTLHNRGSNNLLYQDSTTNQLRLVAYFTGDQLMTVNGLFDFIPSEQQALLDAQWRASANIRYPSLAQHLCPIVP